jgi:RNA polymerase sigma-B factor
VASIGLLKAVDRYDPERGTKFTSYAAPTILGGLKRYFRDCGWALRAPRDLQERALAAKRDVDALSAELGRSATPRETAAALGSAPEDVLEALEVAASYRMVSLDDHHSGGGAGLAELLGTDDATYELVESARRSPGAGTSSLSSSGRSCTSASSMSCPSARSASGSVTHRCTSRGSCGERWRGSR